MDRVRAELLLRDGRVRQRLAVRSERHPPDDLDQAGATCIDDAGRAEELEHLRRPSERVFAAREHEAQAFAEGQLAIDGVLGLLGHLADHRQDRPFDGADAVYRPICGVASRAKRLAELLRADRVLRPERRGHPRTICEKMTPEFPFRP